MQTLTAKFKSENFKILTVHSPEFHHEKDIPLLSERIKFFGLRYPVYIDNNLMYFEALKSGGWPTIFLIDKNGFIRFKYLGETHSYFAQARDIEKKIRLLLDES